MYEHARGDTIRKKDIWDKVRVVFVEDKIEEVRLRWFEHLKRRCMDAPVRR